MSRILTADPGLNTTGFVIADCDRQSRKLVVMGHHKSGSVSDKHESQLSRFRELLDEHGPDVVAVEQFAYFGAKSHGPNSRNMHRLTGAMEEAARGRGIAVIGGINKNVANRSAGLTGKVSARRVKLAVHTIFKIRGITNAHVDDALLVLIAAHQRWSAGKGRAA